MERRYKVLVLATSRHTRGGVSSVVKAHETTDTWKEFSCRWIATHKSGSKLKKLLYFFKGLGQYLIHLPGTQIVHIHTSHLPSANRKRVFLRLAKIMGKKTVVHFHAECRSTICPGNKESYRRLFEDADSILVLSKKGAEVMTAMFPRFERKIRILYNPNPVINREQHGLRVSREEPYILFAGLLTPKKGYADLIRAFAEITDEFVGWKLVMCGSGDIDKAKKLAAELGVAERVEFPGWISGAEKEKLFSEASILCLPSYTEGFPMVVLEAWAYGVPVVTTLVGGLKEIIVDGKNALTFEPGDVGQLVRSLSILMSDKGLRDSISDEAKKIAQRKFDLDTIGGELKKIYLELLTP